MLRPVRVLTLIALSATLFACKKGGASGEAGTPVSLSIQHSFGGQPLAANTSYALDSTTKLRFTKLSYIVSDLVLISENGPEVKLLQGTGRVVNALPGDKATIKVAVGGAPAGKYKGFRFRMGLDNNTNHQDPTQLAADDPLNVMDMHWNWQPAAGYLFMKLEGERDSAGQKKQLLYHLGNDPLYTSITAYQNVPFEIPAQGEAALPVLLDLKPMFNGIELSRETASESMTPQDRTLAEKLARNWPGMFDNSSNGTH